MKASVQYKNKGHLARMIRRIAGVHKHVTVGVPDGKMHVQNGESISMALLGAVHEFGSESRGIPARPWLGPPLKNNQEKYSKFLAQNIMPIMLRRKSAQQVLGMLGEMASGDVKQYIVNGVFRPLSETTIKRKKSSKPLIDTGQLRQSITYTIEG